MCLNATPPRMKPHACIFLPFTKNGSKDPLAQAWEIRFEVTIKPTDVRTPQAPDILSGNPTDSSQPGLGEALSAPPEPHLSCGWHPQEPEYLPGSSGTHPRRTSISKRYPHPGTVTRGLFLSRLLVVDFNAMVKQRLCGLAARLFLRVLFE